MNSLKELRQCFESLGKVCTDFTGYSFLSDGATWGLVSDNPVHNGHEMTLLEWKAYHSMLKRCHRTNEPVTFKPDYTPKQSPGIITTVKEITAPIKVAGEIKRAQGPAITCPHCGISGGVIGMKRWHFDKCKSKK
jgi:hypothetical protein